MNEFDPARHVGFADSPMVDIPLVDLDDITPDETLQAEVRRNRITTPATRVLLALVVFAAAVLGGALLDRRLRPSSSNATSGFAAIAAQLRRGAGGGAGGSGAAGGGAGFGTGGATIGTVKLVDGTNVYVQDLQGNTIKVTTKQNTTVSVTKTGKVSQLAPGSTVIVQGKQSADGTSVAATSITQNAGFGGGGGGGFPGGAPTAG